MTPSPTTPRQKRIDLNPSSADRWTTCTKSPQFIFDNWDKIPQDNGTTWSMEGTTAHEVASSLLLGIDPRPEGCPTPIDEDMWLHGWNYSEYVSGLRKKGSTLLVEQKLPLWYMPGRNAIVDAGIINPQDIHIIDYKYGEGVAVHPEGNLQASIYARSIVTARGIPLGHEFPITLHIFQPRGRNADRGAAHVWETTWGEIRRITDGIQAAADRIQFKLKGLVFAPSEKACRFCPASGFCDARREELTKDIEALATIDDEKPVLPSPGTISIEQLAAVLKHGDQIAAWLKDAEAYALSLMTSGHSIPGFKLVTGRGGNRRWSNPDAAAKLLAKTILREDEIYKRTVIGPSEAEKLLGKNKFSRELTELLFKPPGQPTIAPEDDKREAIGNYADAFDVIQ